MNLRSASALTLFTLLGCGGGGYQADLSSGTAATFAQTEAPPPAAPQATDDSIETLPTPIPEGRKIIFTAHLQLDVEDFGAASVQVDRLAAKHQGFITASQRGGSSGYSRSGQWTLRVPVEEYRLLIDDLSRLGELRDQRETSQEVTDEYYDLEARITTKQQQEQRLLTHLDETARNLEEILRIESELTRVRSEIERMQGRLRLLADQTSLSTIHLRLSEIETFIPAESPTFTTRLSRAWDGSLESLMRVLQSAAITVTAIVPWAVILLVIGFLPALWLRRRLATR